MIGPLRNAFVQCVVFCLVVGSVLGEDGTVVLISEMPIFSLQGRVATEWEHTRGTGGGDVPPVSPFAALPGKGKYSVIDKHFGRAAWPRRACPGGGTNLSCHTCLIVVLLLAWRTRGGGVGFNPHFVRFPPNGEVLSWYVRGGRMAARRGGKKL